MAWGGGKEAEDEDVAAGGKKGGAGGSRVAASTALWTSTARWNVVEGKCGATHIEPVHVHVQHSVERMHTPADWLPHTTMVGRSMVRWAPASRILSTSSMSSPADFW